MADPLPPSIAGAGVSGELARPRPTCHRPINTIARRRLFLAKGPTEDRSISSVASIGAHCACTSSLSATLFVTVTIVTASLRPNAALYGPGRPCSLSSLATVTESSSGPYPTVLSLYGGPRVQSVQNSWSLRWTGEEGVLLFEGSGSCRVQSNLFLR